MPKTTKNVTISAINLHALTIASLPSSASDPRPPWRSIFFKQNPGSSHFGVPRLWNSLIVIICVLLTATGPVSCDRLTPIYWNASNPVFLHKGFISLDVRIRDLVDIVCPYYDASNQLEARAFGFLEIHQVSKSGFTACKISHGSKIVGVCGSPFNHQIVSLSIRRFTPKPGGLEFTPGYSYYFITTSNGTLGGIKNKEGGFCKSHRLKLKLNVFSSHVRHHSAHRTGHHRNNTTNFHAKKPHAHLADHPSRRSSLALYDMYESAQSRNPDLGPRGPDIYLLPPDDQRVSQNQFHDYRHAAYIVADEYWPKKNRSNSIDAKYTLSQRMATLLFTLITILYSSIWHPI